MSQTAKYIVLSLVNKNNDEFKLKSARILEILKSNNIDISNVIILPDDVKIQCIDLPVNEVIPQ